MAKNARTLGVELLGRDAGAEFDQRQRDPFEPEFGLRGGVAFDQCPVLLAARQARVGADRSGQFAEQELELRIVGLLAPQGAVVVEHGHPIGDRDIPSCSEEVDDRLLRGPVVP